MRTRVLSVVALSLGLAAGALSQRESVWTAVRQMSQGLLALGPAQDAGIVTQRVELAVAIRETVRRQIELELNERSDGDRVNQLAAVGAELAKAQIATENWSDAVGAPLLSLQQSAAGPVVFASFGALDGGAGAPHSTPWIWAFPQRNRRFEAVDTAGSDFEGCGLFVQEIPAGRPAETWLLAWGPVFGANQSPIRMRVYSFDGAKLETIWSPSDRLQGKVRLSDRNLEVSYLDSVQWYERRQPPFFRLDRLAPSEQGLVLTETVLTELPEIP